MLITFTFINLFAVLGMYLQLFNQDRPFKIIILLTIRLFSFRNQTDLNEKFL